MSATTVQESTTAWNDYAVGDTVYCLAWIGKRFQIVGKDEQLINLHGDAEFDPYGAQVDIVPASLWMITKKPWDQVWYWPDRKGEHYEAVFERFMSARKVGEVLNGYIHAGALNPLAKDIVDVPENAMAFRVEMIDPVNKQINVLPVVGVVAGADPISDADDRRKPERWIRCGPVVPATISMHSYRWCISVGPFILNWRDFQA